MPRKAGLFQELELIKKDPAFLKTVRGGRICSCGTRLLLVLLCLAGMAHPSVAQIYYVGANGSNSNPGTQAQPFATIQMALNTVPSGGTVEILSGVYRNQFNTMFRSDNVTLQAAPGASVLISGADVVTGWTQVGSSGVYEHTGWTNYFSPQSSGTGDARSLNRNQLFVNGAYLQEVTSLAAVTPGYFYVDPTSHAIYMQLGGNANPNAGTVECTATAGPLLSTNGHSHEVIQGLNFADCANTAQMNSAAVQVIGGSSNVVNNVSVSYAAGAGLGVSGANTQVLNGTFNNNGQEGIASSGATNLLVQNSTTSYNNTLPGKQFAVNWEAGGNKFSASTNTVVNRLIACGNIGNGIWFDISNQSATICNCLVDQNGDGICYEISYGGQVYNNLVSNSRFNRSDVDFNPTTLNPYAPNSQGIYLSSSAYCNVYNNTVVNNSNVGIVSSGPVRTDGSANNYNVYSYGSNLVNNIVAKNSAYQDPASGAGNFFQYTVSNVGGGTDTTGIPNLSPAAPFKESTSNYNLFQLGPNQFGFSSWTYQTFASWRTGTSQDAHSLATNPLFTNPAAGDFTLQPGSPAIGAGAIGSIGMSATVGVNFATLANLPTMTSTIYNVSNGSTSAVTTVLSGSGGLTQTGG
ncbi:MAG: right-handed parallel beta-helix repeat-containing protein, partial [Thermoguttaceae bacterium]